MPSRSKKKRTMKRKKERTNHQTPTNSSCPQGNGTSGDHDDSSDHPLTDEDFSPRASMEAKPEHEHEHEPEHEPEADPESAVSEDASAVPIEQPTVSESEQTEVTTAVPLEVLQESSAHREVREKSGEGSLYSERAEIPVAISRDTPATGPAPLLERRASWWNCCGLLDVFRGSQS
ncbi:uncharacterized protein LOC110024031 [Phalaenopsis equestris]|uniref:uncharacterized protein LOC110024031 n=1 Tax=Phalaenopsis equestris TaxID=78828 RepID=UPI0009E2AB5C|nr:uncharacterized protein LOC110024031 [Phalaenopsis equestris]